MPVKLKNARDFSELASSIRKRFKIAPKVKAVREAIVESYLHTQVVKAGGWTDKFASPGRRGVPDRIVTWPRRPLRLETIKPRRPFADVHFVELKAPGKPLRAEQARDHTRRRKLGATVLVIDSQPQVDKYVRRHA